MGPSERDIIIMTSGEHAKELAEFICNIPLFVSLSREEISPLAEHMHRLQLKSDEILFEQWERADCVYFVENGALEVLTKNGPETYAVVATLRRGRSIGEMSLIDNFPRSATVKARSASTVVCFSKEKFDQLMMDYPAIGVEVLKGLARLMAQNLKKTSSRLADHMLPMG